MKKLIIYAALLYGGFKLLTKKKQIEALKEFLQVRPQNIRNLKFVNNGIKMNVDINLINTSDMEFTMSGLGLIALKKLNFFTLEGNKVATAYPNITNIVILPNSNTLIENVEAVASLDNITGNIMQLLQNPELQTTAEIEILGQTYTI